MYISMEQPTCQGYSFTSVSTPPTILVVLLACPQLHVSVDVLAVVADVAVVVATDEGVVVDGTRYLIKHLEK